MPSQCCAKNCTHRNDNKKTQSCTFFSLPTSATNGKVINGTYRTVDSIKNWKRQLLQNVGYQGVDKTLNVTTDLRICSCHFLPSQIHSGDLIFGSLPFDEKSVQIVHPPTTPSPTQAASSFQAQADEIARLREDNASLRSNLTGANLSILHLQTLYQESQLSVDYMLRAASEKAELPWDSPRTRVSFERLKHDRLFASNTRGMTGLCDWQAVDYLFDICIGFSSGSLPLQYRGAREDSHALGSVSSCSIEEHKNYLFFVLYLIRTGSNSLAIAGMHFGFEESTASRWYTTWVQVLTLVLHRMFPQPDIDLIKKVSPPKFVKQFRGRLVGIIDCTECRMQTSSEKQAQRATWSEYKHNNTVKYLVVISPAGATIYVSPAFPGRISDPQICYACATYANLEDGQALEIFASESEAEDMWE